LPAAAEAFVVAWQLKRFVGGFLSCHDDSIFAFRSGRGGGSAPATAEAAYQADDDRLFDFDGVMFLEGERGRVNVDTRVWEAVLASSGNQVLVRHLAEYLSAGASGSGCAAHDAAAASRDGGRLAFAMEYSASDYLGASGPRRAALGTLTSFEDLLWLERYYSHIVGAAGAGGRLGARSGSATSNDVDWLTSTVGHLRYAVQQVVRAWDAVARGVGFVDVEEMVGPYLLWSAADFCYAPLCRPTDHGDLFAPRSQRWSLFCGPSLRGPALSAVATDEAAAQRLPLADAQLRAVASMFTRHLRMVTSVMSLEELAAEDGDDALAPRPLSAPPRGRLSVGHYKRPAWRRSLSAVPPILNCVVSGLAAFQTVRCIGASAGHGETLPGARFMGVGDATWSSDEERDVASCVTTGRQHRSRSRMANTSRSTSMQSSSSSSNNSSSSSSNSRSSSSSSSTYSSTEADDGGSAGAVTASSSWKPSRLEAFRLRRRAEEREAGRRAAAAAEKGRAGSKKRRRSDTCLGPGAAHTQPPSALFDGQQQSVGALTALDVAAGIVEWATPIVVRVYECRADQLLVTHAIAEAAGKAARTGGTALPAGVVRDPMAAERLAVHGVETDQISAESGGGAEMSTVLAAGAQKPALWPSLAGNVQLVLTDPPYNTRRQAQSNRSFYDVLTVEDARDFVELCRVLLRPGGHVLIFCAWAQVNMWVDLLRASVDQVVVGCAGKTKGDVRAGNDAPAAFIVNSHPTYALRVVHGRVSRGRTSTTSSNMSEVIVRAVRSGADAAAAHVMVNYRSFGAVPSRFRPFDNVIDNVPDLPSDEVLLAVDANGKQFKVRAEQKCVALMTELIQRHSQPGDVVVDPFCGTCTTAAAAMSIPGGQHRRVVVCDAFSDVLNGGRRRLRRTFMEQVSVGGFVRLLGDALEQVRAAAKMVLAAATEDVAGGGVSGPVSRAVDDATCDARRHRPSRAEEGLPARTKRLSVPPAGLPAHTAVPRCLLLMLANVFAREADEQRRLLGADSHPRAPPVGRVVAAETLQLAMKPLELWPTHLRSAFATADPVLLREHGAAASGVFIAQSSLAGGAAGLGLFSARELPAGISIGPFFGALLYGNFGAVRVKSALYAPDVLGCLAPSPADFCSRAMQLGDVRVAAPGGKQGDCATSRDLQGVNNDEGDGDGGETYPLWVCPSPFCWVAFANDPRPTSPAERAVRGAVARAGGVGPGIAAPLDRRVGVGSSARGQSVNANLRCALQQEDGVVSVEDLINPAFCRLVTTCNVAAGAELLLDYGPAYDFGTAAPSPGPASTTPHTFAATIVQA